MNTETEIVLCPRCGSTRVQETMERRQFTLQNRIGDMISVAKSVLNDGFIVGTIQSVKRDFDYIVPKEQLKCRDCGYIFKTE